jgi:hypothetical protein
MRFSGWSHGPLSRAQHLPVIPDLKGPLPFEYQIDLVLFAMHMTLLFLARLETVHVAEEPRRLKDIVFLHLL